ncbi:hypothetical protein ACFQ1M_13485 [Sungkyunkwania multivorans]|uniref:Uncharacterized protein n=1 Tax=Sungkyunkwania multivorans TaxID=1173618 RepID=A0ABW3D2D4_9FLAO
MKKLSILLTIFLSLGSLTAQDFVETKAYTTILESNGEVLTKVSLVGKEDPVNMVASMTITDPDIFDGVYISTLKNNGLEGIKEVLKVELAYGACCTGVQAYYFTVSEENVLTALPMLENIYCEKPGPITQYIFPNQEYGQQGKILRAQSSFNKEFKIDYVSLEKSYSWTQNTFFAEETYAQTFNKP